MNAELDHGFGSAKLSNAELNAVEHIQGVQFRFIGSLNQNSTEFFGEAWLFVGKC